MYILYVKLEFRLKWSQLSDHQVSVQMAIITIALKLKIVNFPLSPNPNYSSTVKNQG